MNGSLLLQQQSFLGGLPGYVNLTCYNTYRLMVYILDGDHVHIGVNTAHSWETQDKGFQNRLLHVGDAHVSSPCFIHIYKCIRS